MKKIILSILFSGLLFFISCSEDDGPNNTNINSDLPDEIVALYENPPDVDDCYEGRLKMSEKLKVLDRLNYFRQIHGLPDVTYDASWDIKEQQSALISVANQTLNHYPEPSYKCYTLGGDTACGQSNLHLSWSSRFSSAWESEMSVDGWINEEHSNSLGHRRWFLSPFLKTVSFGRVDDINNEGHYYVGTSIHVFNTNGAANTTVDFVACPFHEYPSTAFKPNLILSFTAVPDKSYEAASANRNVNFDNANIIVEDDSGKSYSVSNIQTNYERFAVPNLVQWNVSGLKYNQRYNVTIENAIVEGQSKSYEYWFKLVQ